MATTPRERRKSWKSRKVLELTPTSSHFQEALRLYHYHLEDRPPYPEKTEDSIEGFSVPERKRVSTVRVLDPRESRPLAPSLEEDEESGSPDDLPVSGANVSFNSRRRSSVQWADKSYQQQQQRQQQRQHQQQQRQHQKEQQQQRQQQKQIPSSRRLPRRASMPAAVSDQAPLPTPRSILKALQ